MNNIHIFIKCFSLLLMFLLFISPVSAAELSTESNTVTTNVGNPAVSSPRNGFVFYCQGAAEWMNTCSLGAAGCGPTSMAMILSSFGVARTPPEVDRIFQQNGWRSCSDAGSMLTTALQGAWLRDLGFTVAPNLVSGTTLNITQAKQFIDDGYILVASSQRYPCVSCKSAKFIDHIFTVDNVNPATGEVSIRDPNNCAYGAGNTEIQQNIIRSVTSFPWYYAFPVKKTN